MPQGAFSSLLLLLPLFLLPPSTEAYNLDVREARVLRPPQQEGPDLFGYSLAFTNDLKLLVGAPRANRSSLVAEEPGALYSCDPSRAPSGPCVRLTVDATDTGGQVEGHVARRDFAWLGATTVVAGNKGVLTCAPRWSQVYEEDYFMNGACYWGASPAGGAWQPLLPLSELRDQRVVPPGGQDSIYNYQFGQAGLSAAVLPVSGDIVLGAPGVYNWAGTLIRGRQRTLMGGVSLATTVLSPLTPRAWNQYLGYSVTAGRYNGDGELVATSAPRAGNNGKVYILELSASTASMALVAELEGPHAFSGFGLSLASGDFDADGYDEVVVGAPFASADGQTEDGLVEVFSRGPTGLPLVRRSRLQPIRRGGRFGSAVASVGDLDSDGYVDLAVGAPLEEGGRGAVYIYRGGLEGLSPTSSQRVGASQVDQSLWGLGASLTGGVDLDDNGYDDLAVGCSGGAVLLNSRAVIELSLTLTPSPTILTLHGEVFTIEVCVRGASPTALSPLDLSVLVRLDSRLLYSSARAVFTDSGQSETSVPLRVPALPRACAVRSAQLKADTVDILAPLTVTASVTSDGYVTDVATSSCPTCPVLSTQSSLKSSVDLVVAPGCGGDGTCVPSITLNAFFAKGSKYIVGSKELVQLVVQLAVLDETAYSVVITVDLPEGVTVAVAPLECSRSRAAGYSRSRPSSLSCPLQLPVKAGEKVTVNLLTDISALNTYRKAYLEYGVSLTALNAALNTTARLEFVPDLHLQLTGYPEPELVAYDIETASELRRLEFRIQAHNVGTTRVSHVVMKVLVPAAAGREAVLKDVQVKSKINNRGADDCTVGEQYKNITTRDGAKRADEGTTSLRCDGDKDPSCVIVTCVFRWMEAAFAYVTVQVDSAVLQAVAGPGAVATAEMPVWAWSTPTCCDEAPPPSVVNVTVSAIIAPAGWTPIDPIGPPWWVLVLASLGGSLVLGAVVFLLYTCGFFKRTRHPDAVGAGEEAGEAADDSADGDFEEFECLTSGLPFADTEGSSSDDGKIEGNVPEEEEIREDLV